MYFSTWIHSQCFVVCCLFLSNYVPSPVVTYIFSPHSGVPQSFAQFLLFFYSVSYITLYLILPSYITFLSPTLFFISVISDYSSFFIFKHVPLHLMTIHVIFSSNSLTIHSLTVTSGTEYLIVLFISSVILFSLIDLGGLYVFSTGFLVVLRMWVSLVRASESRWWIRLIYLFCYLSSLCILTQMTGIIITVSWA